MKTLTLTDQTRQGWWDWGFPRPPAPPEGEAWRHCYLRFGDLPKGGQSYAYSYNASTGKHDGYYEPGVGVFQAYESPEADEYIVDLEMKPHLAAVYLRTMNRPKYLVEGPVVGYGAAT